MNFLAVLVLFISVESSTATDDRTFHKKNKINGGGTLSVVFANATTHKTVNESQQAGDRRSVVKATASAPCYTPFFVGNQPPIGFKTRNMKYICQRSGRTPCFSTMFDVSYGIPVYSAYVVKKSQAVFSRATRVGLNFRQLQGLAPQGTAKMYSETNRGLPNNLKIHKGHLVPAETYSFKPEYMRSTFTYTNAVPQYGRFNSGQWAQHEKKIRNYATNVCSKNNGDLYLLTGISDVLIKFQGTTITSFIPLGTPKRMPKKPNIVIPNSMWTAGCCISPASAVKPPQVLGSFAVIGNNVSNKLKILMSQLTVEDLEAIISVGLFPGNSDCSNNKYDVTI